MNDDAKELGLFSSWLDEFYKDETEITYMAFLRLLSEYYALQSRVVDNALELENEKNK